MPGLQFTRELIKRLFNCDVQSIADLHTIHQVCCLVRNRAARQGAMFCSAPLLKTGTTGLATIAVDGSVYEKMPSFQKLYAKGIERILGKESNVKVMLQKDGSGIGAAMIAALAWADRS